MELPSQTDTNWSERKDVKYYAMTDLIKYFGKLNIVNLNSFTLQRYILGNFVSNVIKCSISLNWFTLKRQNWVFALIYDRVKVLRGHTPYNKVGIIFFIWVRPHWKSLTKTYLNLNTIELFEQLPTLNAMLHVLQVKNKVSRLTFHGAVFSVLPQNIRKPLKRDQWHGMG